MNARTLLTAIREPLHVLGNGDVRRLITARLLIETSGPAYGTALIVYAYTRGGPAVAGVVGLAVMLPAGVVAPFAGVLADRGSRARVAAVAAAARAGMLAASAAAILLGLPLAVAVVFAALASVPARVLMPAQLALLPRLTRSDAELVAATALSSAIENLGWVAGPAIAGALLIVVGPGEVITLSAAVTLVAAGVVRGVREAGTTDEGSGSSRAVDHICAGLIAVARIPTLRLVFCVYSFQTAIFGLLTVVVVELAVADLGAGEGGVGALNATLGFGGVVGGLGAMTAASRLGLGPSLRVGTLLWGVPMVVLAVLASLGAALAAFAVIGVGNVLVDVSAYALIQQATPDYLRGRVFAALEGAAVATIALGSLAGGALVVTTGAAGGLAVAGLSLVLVALVTWRSLGQLDRTRDTPEARSLEAVSPA